MLKTVLKISQLRFSCQPVVTTKDRPRSQHFVSVGPIEKLGRDPVIAELLDYLTTPMVGIRCGCSLPLTWSFGHTRYKHP